MAQRSQGLVVLIGLFKLVKAATLVTVGVLGLVFRRGELVWKSERAISWLGLSAGRSTMVHGVDKLSELDRATVHRLAVLALAYAAVFLVEGVGLVLRKTWAEWLTVVVTGSFIPIEIYELCKHPGAGKVVTLIVNVAIVGYLIVRRLGERSGVRRLVPA
jgi:uncharacterized membrane protein (DUF2068 family)